MIETMIQYGHPRYYSRGDGMPWWMLQIWPRLTGWFRRGRATFGVDVKVYVAGQRERPEDPEPWSIVIEALPPAGNVVCWEGMEHAFVFEPSGRTLWVKRPAEATGFHFSVHKFRNIHIHKVGTIFDRPGWQRHYSVRASLGVGGAPKW